MNDEVNYLNSVERIINEDNQLFTTVITKITITEEIKDDSANSGDSYITNNQNGMGDILSPQP